VPTNTSSTDNGDHFLFGHGECNKPLPVNAVTKQLEFGAVFPALADDKSQKGDKERRDASWQYSHYVAPASPYQKAEMLMSAPASASLTLKTIYGNSVPMGDESRFTLRQWNKPLVQDVVIKDVGQVLLNPQIKVSGSSKKIPLTENHLRTLLKGAPTVLSAPTTKDALSTPLRLIPGAEIEDDTPQASACDGSLSVQVADLARFAANPRVTLPGGKTAYIKLSGNSISKLMHGSAAEVMVGRQKLVLQPVEKTVQTSRSAIATREASIGATGIMQAVKEVVGSRQSTPHKLPVLMLYVPFKQTWKLLGYERGALINSVALAPQEEVTVEVFSWDRRKSSQEFDSTDESESTSERNDLDRDTQDLSKELTNTNEFHWGVNGKLEYKGIASIGFDVGSTNTTVTNAKNSKQRIQEATTKAVSKVKSTRHTKVSETAEYGSEQRVSRRLKNPNLCHAVHYHYFEVQARYSVSTAVDPQDIRFVTLLDNPLKELAKFDNSVVRENEGVLRRVLMDNTLTEGFRAARLLYTYDNAHEVVCKTNACGVNADPTLLTTDAAKRELITATRGIAGAIFWLKYWGEDQGPRLLFEQHLDVPDFDTTEPLGNCEAAFLAWLYRFYVNRQHGTILASLHSAFSGLQQEAVSGMLNVTESSLSDTTFDVLHTLLTQADVVAALNAALSPDAQMQADARQAVYDEATKAYKDLKPSADVVLLAVAPCVLFLALAFVCVAATTAVLYLAYPGIKAGEVRDQILAQPGVAAPRDAGLAGSVSRFSTAYDAYQSAKTLAASSADAVAKVVEKRRSEREAEFRALFPPSRILDAKERFDALQKHLINYSDYYLFVIWRERSQNNPANWPQDIIASMGSISPFAIALINGKLAFPLDESRNPTAAQWRERFIKDNKELLAATDSDEVTLPTPGLHIEPKLSECSACEEFIEDSRQLEVRTRRAKARQEESEARRMEDRVTAKNYEPPQPLAAPVIIKMEPPTT